jgi:UDP-N-acetylglucosamine diphosphorylase / glucose-1-phosphate thymidylyltransferase / UDP-N-acetylgalactosamine diphosphorylase / glucosamine-1-phosphate N-acetyltransferase / galactosamine-1-phosphate N-acetyltransferase
MDVLLFEDAAVSQLDPIAIGKPAFAISCGGRRLLDIVLPLGSLHAHVRPHLRQLVEADYPAASLSGNFGGGPLLVINARLVPDGGAVKTLASLAASKDPRVLVRGESVAAAILDANFAGQLRRSEEPIDQQIRSMQLASVPSDAQLFEFPHDVIRHHLTSFGENLGAVASSTSYRQTADGVFLAEGATLGPYVTTDTTKGPIVLDAGASVGPYCYLRGPVHLGPGTRVLENSVLKDGVSTGHTVKIGGEVEASIIEPFTNKQHHGFLGHSYLGSWINLGAGTCNSDLKNTYGTVNMEYRGKKVNTGMQFVGAIIGDYAKTAINTGVFTGKTIGVCSMVYGFVTTNVPSFVNYARLFGQVTEAPVEVMVSTQRRMFARRGVEQRPCDIQLLHDMYALTAHERQALGETLSIEPLSL